MSCYCLNPACTDRINPAQDRTCQACGSNLVLRDRYRATKLLGRGGFATTFLAIDQSLPGQPNCVVKQLCPRSSTPDTLDIARELFQREAKTLGTIGDHPQFPRLLDYFELKQGFYLIQEYVSGFTLHQSVRHFGLFDEAMVKAVLTEVLLLLDYLHNHRVIHRDIKPDNLIRRSIDQKLVLIDFGAVKDQTSQLAIALTEKTATSTALSVGTPGFAPPEQMAMRPVYASDIYSLAVTCLYLMTGQSPKQFSHDPTTGELCWRHRVSVSPHFEAVLTKMLAASVQDRYQSAKEALDALELTDLTADLSQPSGTSIPTVPNTANATPVMWKVALPSTEAAAQIQTHIQALWAEHSLAEMASKNSTPSFVGHRPAASQPTELESSALTKASIWTAKPFKLWVGGGLAALLTMAMGFNLRGTIDRLQLTRSGLDLTEPRLSQPIAKDQVGGLSAPMNLSTQQPTITPLTANQSPQAIPSHQIPVGGHLTQTNRPVTDLPPSSNLTPSSEPVQPYIPSRPAASPTPVVPWSSQPDVRPKAAQPHPGSRPAEAISTPQSPSRSIAARPTAVSVAPNTGGGTLPQPLPTPEMPAPSPEGTQPDQSQLDVAAPISAIDAKPPIVAQTEPNPQLPPQAVATLIPRTPAPSSHDLANAIARGLLVAHHKGDVLYGSLTYRKVQDVIYRLRLSDNRHEAAQRSGVPQVLIEKLLLWGGLPVHTTQPQS